MTVIRNELTGKSRRVIELAAGESIECFVSRLTEVVCRVIEASPLQRPLLESETALVTVGVRATVWGARTSITPLDGGGLHIDCGAMLDEEDWATEAAYHVGLMMRHHIANPAVFEYLAEELPPLLREAIGVVETGAMAGDGRERGPVADAGANEPVPARLAASLETGLP